MDRQCDDKADAYDTGQEMAGPLKVAYATTATRTQEVLGVVAALRTLVGWWRSASWSGSMRENSLFQQQQLVVCDAGAPDCRHREASIWFD